MTSDKWRNNIDRQIEQAQAEGKFDNLPGKGKPLNLEENPFEDPAMRNVFRMLRDSGFSLPWIEELKRVDADLKRARADLARRWNWYQNNINKAPVFAEEEWSRAMDDFKEKVEKINKRISNYNLGIPSARFERLKINADRENKAVKEGNNEM